EMFVNKFLFCIDLKWAALVIGGVDIILSLLAGLWLRWMRRIRSQEYLYWTLPESPSFFKIKDIDQIYLNKFGYVMFTFLLVILALHICACLFLIVSCFTNQAILVAPYVCTSLMRFVLLLIILIWIVTKSFDSPTAYAILGLSLGTFPYFWLTVVSWFQASA
ncbi:hypothetical protein KR018_003997, partial [Drosophila ironensis]